MNQNNLISDIPGLSDVLGVQCSHQDALKLLMRDPETYQKFQSFPPGEQKKLLSFITGQRGLKITYDSFFQKIMSPELHPGRLESFLSELMGEEVHIERILPREGIRLAEEASLIIMDILVQLSDGSRVNVEMQKIGLYFPGERSGCYAADAIMRQYTELKSRLKEKFSYKEMKPFFLIVLMEHSSSPFRKAAPNYIHTEKIYYDSGAEVASLAKIKYVSLDTFRDSLQNISNKLEAWLTFFSSDEPADIIALVNTYPEFRELYQEIAEFRTKPEELIYMYSEALAIADRNTIRLMIDDMKEELDSLTNQVAEQKNELARQESELARQESELARRESELARQENELSRQENELAKQGSELAAAQDELTVTQSELAAKDDEIARLKAENERLRRAAQ